ncbi:MAG: hypothetical protein A3G32_08595 [Deltaproteobacteria bacterium RIFCSPLOWO2_12_FULL_40_28]|nr:MAG: hypothetical protein A3C45_01295 [Deltaproteobacteria bacterium RIFCSPHIGHO2_02_FULL_40_28]OGQ20962.1 MAG: hypothetical protein A3E27_03960 [Deltaproteobacteria bacterium RIFCSPHIGHO2_12_FULL_40_32]OGQ39363.1 MAG: hypothetical protein A3I69_05320 [Deltaproteobacteria bacterium RIFCSPLOWO2_02_FULL_40_36]OGQ54644.1 MAG: hypothetical protein A3G32_08595 [Deltaproteobacteria bacterium RIFCSPLOWO2_12_FULL_40_28]
MSVNTLIAIEIFQEKREMPHCGKSPCYLGKLFLAYNDIIGRFWRMFLNGPKPTFCVLTHCARNFIDPLNHGMIMRFNLRQQEKNKERGVCQKFQRF